MSQQQGAAAQIRLEGVTKEFRVSSEQNILALEDISFDVRKGEFVTIVGPSGCGKSTLLKLVAGVMRPTRGRILANGVAVDQTKPLLGMVFQKAVLLEWRKVIGNVLFTMEMLGQDPKQHTAKAKELLKLVGLEGFEERYIWELSGGMQQRVSICRALIHDPPILLMDEPFGALDALTRDQMNLELQRIWEATRKTVLFVTHSIPEAIFLADRVLVMSPRPGKIIKTLDIDIPRPRTLEAQIGAKFSKYVAELRSSLSATIHSKLDF